MPQSLLETLEERRLLSAASDWVAALYSVPPAAIPSPAATAPAVRSSSSRAAPQRKSHHYIPPPNAPADFTLLGVTSNSITTQFHDMSEDETGFVIQRSVNGSPWAYYTALPGFKHERFHEFSNILLKSGVTYSYRIAAVGAGGTSAYSNAVTATPVADPVTTPPPTTPPPVTNPTPPPTNPGEVARNILFVGNSFTIYNDVPDLVATIAQADGHPRPFVAGQLHLGWGLADHLTQIAQEGSSNVIYSSLPAGQTWDDVIYQDLTERATTDAGDVAGFVSDSLKIVADVEHQSPKVHVIGFETWARGPMDFVYPSIFPDPDTMEAQNLAGYTLARNDLNAIRKGSAEVSPVGEAWKALGYDRSLYDGDDEYHSSAKGSLLAALMLYKTTYHDDVSDIPASAVSGTLASLGLTAADWATLTAVTDSIPAVK